MRTVGLTLIVAVLVLGAVAAVAWQRAGADREAGLSAQALGMAGVLEGAALEALDALEAAEEQLVARLAAVARRADGALSARDRPPLEILEQVAREERVGRLAWFDEQGRLLALARHPAPVPARTPEAQALRERADALERDDLEAALARLAAGPGEVRREGLRPNRFASHERFGVVVGRADGGRLLLRADADALAALRRRFGVGPVLARVRAQHGVLSARLVDPAGRVLLDGAAEAPTAEPVPLPRGGWPPGPLAEPVGRGVRAFVPFPLPDGQRVAIDLLLSGEEAEAGVRRSRTVVLLGAALGGLSLLASGALLTLRERRQRIAKAQARAEREEQARLAEMGALTALVTHELSNPLNSVRLGLSLLTEEAPPQTRARVLATLADEVGRMGRTLEAFLGVARRPADAPHPVGPEVLERVRTRAAAEAAQRHVSLIVDAVPGAPAALGDPLLLEQALTNLARNALRASPTGGEVRLAWRAPDGEGVTILVEDAGPGFPAQGREELLRVGAAGRPEGHGLGLPLAERFVRQMGGRLELRDRPGGGACVALRLPRASQ